MPVVAIFLGLMLVASAVRGTEHQLAAQLGKDFSGTGFLSWGAAISITAAVGGVPGLKTLSEWSLALIIIVMVLRNGGLFQQLANVIEHPPAASSAVPLSSYGSSGSSSGASASSGGISPTSLLQALPAIGGVLS